MYGMLNVATADYVTPTPPSQFCGQFADNRAWGNSHMKRVGMLVVSLRGK